MDTVVEEQLDYEEEYGGAQKMQYQGGGAIHALADDEVMGEEDDYDDLYSDVNVGESFAQMQRSEPPMLHGVSQGNQSLQGPQVTVPKQKMEVRVSQIPSVPGLVPEQGAGSSNVDKTDGATVSGPSQVRIMGFQVQMPSPNITPTDVQAKFTNEPAPLPNSGNGDLTGARPMQTNQMRINMNMNNTNVNPAMVNENQIRPVSENGSTMLFVGELHWWTTDEELETLLSQYGRVKEIKFFDERASGKSKGYCQVEFFDPAAATACKERMNGYVFNGRPCVVAFASPQTLKQMGASYVNKNPVQGGQAQPQERRPLNDGVGRGGGGMNNYQGGDNGRSYGRGGGWGRGGQGMANRGPGAGTPMRGRGGGMGGSRGNFGNNSVVGNGMNYGQGFTGPGFGGSAAAMNMMHPQGMMGAGFDPTYMGRGGGYGGFPGAAFPGMMPSYPNVNMGLAGVAPHVNPAFFGRGMTPNAMGMMGPTGMEGHHLEMWTDTSMSGWGGGGEEQQHGGRRTRESSYVGDDGTGSDYGYGGGEAANHEKGGSRSNATAAPAPREKEPDRSKNVHDSRRHHREHDRERSDRDQRYSREERDSHHDNRRRDKDKDDWDREQSRRSRSRSRVIPEDDHRSRSRDVDYGKRRRLPSE